MNDMRTNRGTPKEARVHPDTLVRLRTMLAVEDGSREINGLDLASVGRLTDLSLIEDLTVPMGQMKIAWLGRDHCPCGAELPPGWLVCAGCFIRSWR